MTLESILSPRPRLTGAPLVGPLASDERLAKLVGRGDEIAFQLLYKRYHRPLYRYCFSLLRNEADAEDALQCAFVAALQSLRREQRDLPVRPWLFRIAHNESISVVRRRRRVHEAATHCCEVHTVALEDQVEERESLALLVADLRALPERQRAAILMRELSGLSHKEIALALGASVDAAKQSIFEARRSLTEFTEGRAMDCEDVRRMISDADGRMLRSRRLRAHVRHCSPCTAFAAAIPDRSGRLQALTPGLPPAAAAALARWVAGSMGTGDSAGITAGVGKAAGVGIGAAMKVGAMTTVAAVLAVGTGIELPQVLAHHPGRAAAIRSAQPREVRGHPPPLPHSPAAGAVGVAARASATTAHSHRSPAPRHAAWAHVANSVRSTGVVPAERQPTDSTKRPGSKGNPEGRGNSGDHGPRTGGNGQRIGQSDGGWSGRSSGGIGRNGATGNRSGGGTGNHSGGNRGDSGQGTGSNVAGSSQNSGGSGGSSSQSSGEAAQGNGHGNGQGKGHPGAGNGQGKGHNSANGQGNGHTSANGQGNTHGSAESVSSNHSGGNVQGKSHNSDTSSQGSGSSGQASGTSNSATSQRTSGSIGQGKDHKSDTSSQGSGSSGQASGTSNSATSQIGSAGDGQGKEHIAGNQSNAGGGAGSGQSSSAQTSGSTAANTSASSSLSSSGPTAEPTVTTSADPTPLPTTTTAAAQTSTQTATVTSPCEPSGAQCGTSTPGDSGVGNAKGRK